MRANWGKGRALRSVYQSEAGPSVVVVHSSLLSNFSNLKHGISTRIGGVSPEPYGLNLSFNVGDARENVEENRNRFFETLGIPPDRIAIPEQRHTATIRTVTQPGQYKDCDALVTNVRGTYLSVSIADCAPIFLFDRKKEVVACVHAGWRGTEQRIVSQAIKLMTAEFGSEPTEILAFIGPSAGPCCYEIGAEVAGKFEEDYLSSRAGKIYLDIKKANSGQLRAAGVPDSNTEVLNDCTICGAERYHSFRRDRTKSGRMVAIIGMIQ